MKAKAEASSAGEESGDGEMKDEKRDVSAAMEDQPLDFRVVIYEDTFRMLKSEPLTGVGLGQFPYLFPQYRQASIINAHCRHPESNWLALAAEAGWPTAVMTALAVGGFFRAGIRAARRRQHGWPLALGTLLAAAAVPFHGIFDMPAYHEGIAWTALVASAGLVTVSNQLLADSNPAVDALATADLAKRLVALEETAFLNGKDSPTVETGDADFNQLGIAMRGWIDFGVSLQEFRGGVRSAGS